MGTPRRDTDPLFTALIPESQPPWVPQAGVTPVGAHGTTPLRPSAPGTALDPATDPFLSMDIRDFNPPDSDIAKGKGKGKGKPIDKGKGKGKKGQGKGRGKLKPPSYKLPIPFPYFKGFLWGWYGSSMGMGVPLLGVPRISLD